MGETMKIVIYDTKTNEVSRIVTGPESMIENQNLSEDEKIITGEEIDIPKTEGSLKVDENSGKVIQSNKSKREEVKSNVREYVEVCSKINTLNDEVSNENIPDSEQVQNVLSDLEKEKKKLQNKLSK